MPHTKHSLYEILIRRKNIQTIQSAKRLIHLYLLNIEIPEKCHRAISRIFEYLDFDDSRDVESDRAFTNFTLETKKYDISSNYVCTCRDGFFENVIDFRGTNSIDFLSDIRRLCFVGFDSHVSYGEIGDFINPFIFCILERKGIIAHEIIF